MSASSSADPFVYLLLSLSHLSLYTYILPMYTQRNTFGTWPAMWLRLLQEHRRHPEMITAVLVVFTVAHHGAL